MPIVVTRNDAAPTTVALQSLRSRRAIVFGRGYSDNPKQSLGIDFVNDSGIKHPGVSLTPTQMRHLAADLLDLADEADCPCCDTNTKEN